MALQFESLTNSEIFNQVPNSPKVNNSWPLLIFAGILVFAVGFAAGTAYAKAREVHKA